MKNVLSIFFLMLSVTTFGQSKKVINQKLKSELSQKAKTYDSLIIAYSEAQLEIKSLRMEINEKKEAIQRYIHEEGQKRSAIQYNRRLLAAQGGNPDSIITENALMALKSPAANAKYIWETEVLKPKIELKRVEKLQEITDMKVKLQNELLTFKIQEYERNNRSINSLLVDDKKDIDQLKKTKQEYISVFLDYPGFNKQLEEKGDALAIKFYELRKQREEQNRLAEEKEYEAAIKKSKNKFVPSVIVDDVVPRRREEEPILSSTLSKRMEYSPWRRGSYGEAPEPEPEPEPVRNINEPIIHDVVEDPAAFPGGTEALLKYLKDNIVLPKEVTDQGISGRAYLRFVVSETGSISNIKLVKGVADCEACDQEAIRVVKTMPKWIPGKNDGKAVNQWYTLPVKFKAE